jgi:hypothetical protein
MAEDRPGPEEQTKIEVKIEDDVAQGMYINLALVHHTENDFTLDLMYVPPHGGRATVRARAISSPKHTKRLLLALQEQIRRYEERFGNIDLSGPDPAESLMH